MYPHEHTFRARGSLGAEYLPFNDDKALPATLPLSPTKCTHTRACAGLLKPCACPFDDDKNAATAILALTACFPPLSRDGSRRAASQGRARQPLPVRVRSPGQEYRIPPCAAARNPPPSARCASAPRRRPFPNSGRPGLLRALA